MRSFNPELVISKLIVYMYIHIFEIAPTTMKKHLGMQLRFCQYIYIYILIAIVFLFNGSHS